MGHLRLFLILIAVFVTMLFAQDSTQTTFQQQAAIHLSAHVEQNKIPQNRTVIFKLTLEWYGDLDRFEVHPFDNPIVQNFEIIGSGSSNRVGVKGGEQAAIREYTFTLKPQAMGMGYVEGMIVKYTDRTTDMEYRLISNRVPVEVIDPLPEPGDKGWILWVFAICFMCAALAFAIWRVMQKKIREKKSRLEETKVVPVEELYLAELKQTADFTPVQIDAAKILNDISKLLRRFFTERYDTLDSRVTTNEFINYLYANKFDDLVVKDVKEILTTADLVKFSGTGVERDAAERAFTLAENILQKSLRHEIVQENDQNLL